MNEKEHRLRLRLRLVEGYRMAFNNQMWRLMNVGDGDAYESAKVRFASACREEQWLNGELFEEMFPVGGDDEL